MPGHYQLLTGFQLLEQYHWCYTCLQTFGVCLSRFEGKFEDIYRIYCGCCLSILMKQRKTIHDFGAFIQCRGCLRFLGTCVTQVYLCSEEEFCVHSAYFAFLTFSRPMNCSVLAWFPLMIGGERHIYCCHCGFVPNKKLQRKNGWVKLVPYSAKKHSGEDDGERFNNLQDCSKRINTRANRAD